MVGSPTHPDVPQIAVLFVPGWARATELKRFSAHPRPLAAAEQTADPELIEVVFVLQLMTGGLLHQVGDKTILVGRGNAGKIISYFLQRSLASVQLVCS